MINSQHSLKIIETQVSTSLLSGALDRDISWDTSLSLHGSGQPSGLGSKPETRTLPETQVPWARISLRQKTVTWGHFYLAGNEQTWDYCQTWGSEIKLTEMITIPAFERLQGQIMHKVIQALCHNEWAQYCWVHSWDDLKHSETLGSLREVSE